MEKENKHLLIIFTRNIVKGKCKTRLASVVGDDVAMEIYRFLVNHTVEISKDLPVQKWVFYSDKIEENDLFNRNAFEKYAQEGEDLGKRMHNAFNVGFAQGYENIIIIGSDMYEISQKDLELAFEKLEQHDYVIGPAKDGGYYLLGMKSANSAIFDNKNWGTSSVLTDTLKDIDSGDLKLLSERNDVDVIEDIKEMPDFQRFLKEIG